MTVQPVTYQSRNCWVDLAVNWCSSETKYRPCLEQWIFGIRHFAQLRRGEMMQYGIQSSARKPVSDSTWTSDHCSHVLIVTSRCCFLFFIFLIFLCQVPVVPHRAILSENFSFVTKHTSLTRWRSKFTDFSFLWKLRQGKHMRVLWSSPGDAMSLDYE